MIITNPFRRCSYCKGREVLEVEDDLVTYTSLVYIGEGTFACKDQKECERNILEEATEMKFKIDEGNGVITPTKLNIPNFEVAWTAEYNWEEENGNL